MWLAKISLYVMFQNVENQLSSLPESPPTIPYYQLSRVFPKMGIEISAIAHLCIIYLLKITYINQLHCYVFQFLCQTTVLAVLDTMIQPCEGNPAAYTVYYNILDGDQHGRSPKCKNFDSSEKSCLYKIAKNNNKVTVNICYTKFSCLFRRWYIMMSFDYC